ncbi:tetratricopeptide repeat protein [Candidatus Nitrotoga sp. 1052]|uniref:tetratricopeptide repeat protein n=1 Tax=Candidatus Nitrotoga sp. 1052 TaxID=2886964 RepID=UPI001F8CD43C|nr:tetratricopeptide repeat protein [Candidatus Nitrotoga sp. 1052]CAH1077733.1 hypothetical protein NTG1052_300086 [Candidatus Nitrotoga sp. 1052]
MGVPDRAAARNASKHASKHGVSSNFPSKCLNVRTDPIDSNGIAFAEDSPTLDQVYQAAHAGKLADAQKMMDKVLKEHPNSAKAHFVEAEILAKQGQMGQAEAELNIAERLKPDLSFAKPQAVQDLKKKNCRCPAC